MQMYLIENQPISPDNELWQPILQRGHVRKIQLTCLCLPIGRRSDVYIALVQGKYILKRLPNSGPRHAPHCEHYEPPPELTGLGQVTGAAIRENLTEKTTTLSLDFSLTKGRSRHISTAGDTEQESVRSDGTKLTMRGLMHFLMDEAGLTRWTPAMAGRRSWYVVRRELLKGASSKITKGQPLPALLHIPESFTLDRADEIRQRQRTSLARLSESTSARMILLGEVKAIEDARYGKCLVVKHMPDAKLMMTDDLHKHLVSRFAHQLQIWSQLEVSHLVMLATISRSAQGVLSIEAACLMNVNEHWLPFESLFEWELLDALHRAQRRFTKGLRYNLPSTKPLASVVLQDTGEVSAALFVVPQDAEGEYDVAIEELTQQSNLHAWKWHAGSDAMPKLPPTWAEQQEQRDQREHVQQSAEHARDELSQRHRGQHESADHELPAEPGEPDEAFEQR